MSLNWQKENRIWKQVKCICSHRCCDERQSTAQRGLFCRRRRRCRAQHKQALPELWNLKLTEKLFYYKFAFLFFVSAKKVRCFSPLICGDACSMSSVVEKAKMQFVIVRSIVKGKNHL